MALIKCPECGHQVSDKAEACPSCGFKPTSKDKAKLSQRVQRDTSKDNKMGKIVILALSAVIISAIVVSRFIDPIQNDNKESTEWRPGDEKIMAYLMTEDWVKQRLKSPSTAKFPKSGEYISHITRSSGVYTINSWVDSQNSFGAITRTKFRAEVENTAKGKWRCNSLEFIE